MSLVRATASISGSSWFVVAVTRWSAPGLYDWVRALLEMAAARVTASGRGCLISGSMIMCHPDAQAVSDKLAGHRTAFRRDVAVRLEHWLTEPEADDLARYLVTVMQGLSVQARDSATMRNLAPTIERAAKAM